MPINAGIDYQKAEQEYYEAKTTEQKIKALKKMLTLAPTHKGAEKLRSSIKQRLAKLKYTKEKEIKQVKRGHTISIKKEGAAQVVLIGKTNSGKSLLLSKITNAKPEIAAYEFTTKKPEFGIMDYNGVEVQIVEIPAIVEDFLDKENGPALMSIVRSADLMVIVAIEEEDFKFVLNELQDAAVDFDGLIVFNSAKNIKNYYTLDFNGDISDIKEKIWSRLGLIYVYTKQPGKKKDFPPVALEKGSNVKDLTLKVHKDFMKINIKDKGKTKIIIKPYARVWGKSVKHDGTRVGMSHQLECGDVVELHKGK